MTSSPARSSPPGSSGEAKSPTPGRSPEPHPAPSPTSSVPEGSGECYGPVDHDSLAKAIRRSVGHEGMRPEDARTIAAHVLNFFGFNERIIDNVLEPDDRDTFYMLEDSGILETERDETTLYDGREWRIHYWMFRKERIFDLAREEREQLRVSGEKDVVYSVNANRAVTERLPHGEHGTGLADHAVYHELTDEIWLERKQAAAAAAAARLAAEAAPSKRAAKKSAASSASRSHA